MDGFDGDGDVISGAGEGVASTHDQVLIGAYALLRVRGFEIASMYSAGGQIRRRSFGNQVIQAIAKVWVLTRRLGV
jgi:hypothetical protein